MLENLPIVNFSICQIDTLIKEAAWGNPQTVLFCYFISSISSEFNNLCNLMTLLAVSLIMNKVWNMTYNVTEYKETKIMKKQKSGKSKVNDSFLTRNNTM